MNKKLKEISNAVEQKILSGEITQLERALFNLWLSHGRLTGLERALIDEIAAIDLEAGK